MSGSSLRVAGRLIVRGRNRPLTNIERPYRRPLVRQRPPSLILAPIQVRPIPAFGPGPAITWSEQIAYEAPTVGVLRKPIDEVAGQQPGGPKTSRQPGSKPEAEATMRRTGATAERQRRPHAEEVLPREV